MFRALTLCVALTAVVAVRAEHTPVLAAASLAKHADDYKMDVAAIPGPAGPAGLRVAIKHSFDGSPVRRLEVVDGKVLHLFVVSRDLKFFRHLYPTPLPDGAWEALELIPAGEYFIAADFKPVDGLRQFLRRIVNLGGDSKTDARAPQRAELPGAGPAGAYDIVTNVRIQPLPGVPTAGQRTAFHVMLSRTEDGRPLVNLEPYLGGAGCLLAVKDDLTDAVRAQAPPAGLPLSLLTFDMTFPTAGTYVVWVEFRRFEENLAARFAVTAR